VESLFDHEKRIDRIHPSKEMLGRIVAMLTRLVDRFDADESRALALLI
jgi:hypothetical protein